MGQVYNNYPKTESDVVEKYLGTSYIVENQAEFEPGRQSDFILKIKFKRNLYDTAGELVAEAEKASETLALSIKNFTGPTYNLDKIAIRTGNNVVNYAGAPSVSDGSITFTDYVGRKTDQILFAWYCMAHNPVNDKIGFKEYYAQDGLLYKWAPNGTRQISWLLKGCWLNSYATGSFDKSQTTQREISTTIVYDRCLPYSVTPPSSWAVTKDPDKKSAPYTKSDAANYLGTQD